MILEPKPATLRRYGLSLAEWLGMLERQGGVCYVCREVPPSNKLCVDHVHVKGWKRMPPEQRKLWVRGALCSFCNYRLVAKGMTAIKARRVAEYLEAFDARAPLWPKTAPKKVRGKPQVPRIPAASAIPAR